MDFVYNFADGQPTFLSRVTRLSIMELGTVVTQSSPYRCTFVREDGTSKPVYPGDLAEIVLRDGTSRMAIVEDMHGERALSGGPRYEYPCRLFEPTLLEDLVGLTVRLPASNSIREFVNSGPDPKLVVGELSSLADHVPVSVRGNSFLATHTCLFGASGSGKSTLLGLIIEELLLKVPGFQVVIFDPNSDFSHFQDARDASDVNTRLNQCAPVDPGVLSAAQGALRSLVCRLNQSPLIAMDRLSPLDVLALLSVSNDPATELSLALLWETFKRYQARISADSCLQVLAQAQGTTSADVPIASEVAHRLNSLVPDVAERRRAILSVNSIMRRVRSSPVWSAGPTDSLTELETTTGARLIQFDLGRLPFLDRSVVAENALRVLWERNQHDRHPTLVVVDEAHNLCPAVATAAWQARTADWINRFAAEGRKYGLHLLIASQRPAKIHPNTLDNCRNFCVMRLQNRDDVETLQKNTLEVSPALLASVSTLPRYEGLIFGDASSPVFVRVGRRRMK